MRFVPVSGDFILSKQMGNGNMKHRKLSVLFLRHLYFCASRSEGLFSLSRLNDEKPSCKVILDINQIVYQYRTVIFSDFGLKYKTLFTFEKRIHTVRDSLHDFRLIFRGLHQHVLVRICHKANLHKCCRNLAPVIAAHGIRFPYASVDTAGRLAKIADDAV